MGSTYPDQAEPIARVVPGMTVVDSTGAEVGKVELVKMGDPGAVTAEGQDLGENRGLVGAIGDSVWGEEPKVPASVAARLVRLGYLKVDGKGLFDTDRYVASDEIAEVTEDTVTLSVPRDQLTKEG